MAKLNVFTYENLSLYDSLIKQYINAGDAKSIKKVTLDGRTLSFFKSEAEGATADFVVTIPEQDLQPLLTRIKANEDAIAAINNENTGLLHQAKVYADEKVKALADGAVADNTAAIEAINNESTGILKQAKDYADGKDASIKAAKDAADAAQADVDALETAVGKMYTNEQIDKAISDAQTAATFDPTELEEAIAANAEAVEKAQGEVDALEEKVNAMYTNDQIDGFVSGVQGEVDDLEGVVAELAQTVADNETDIEAKVKAIADDYLVEADKTELSNAIQANAEAIEAHKTAVDNKVTTLIGDDAGKSVRTIANEELVAQIIPEAAKESLDTLEEIAAWIQSHPEDASAMNKAIEDLTALVGTLPEDVEATTVAGYVAELVAAEEVRAKGIEGGLETRLQAVETAVGEGGSVDAQIDAKIAELDANVTSAEVEEGKGIQVQVVEVDGKVTNVAVTGNYDNSYDAKGAAAAAETAAKGHADTLNTAMNDRVTAIEGLVGEGFRAIPESEINALFA